MNQLSKIVMLGCCLGIGSPLATAAESISAQARSPLPAPPTAPRPQRPDPTGGVAASMRGSIESRPDLAWTSPNPTSPDPVKSTQEVPGPSAAIQAMMPDRPSPLPISVVTFAPNAQYRASLSQDLRTEGGWIEIGFSSGVGEDPAKGTKISIDGAVIGFQKPIKEGFKSAVQVMVRIGSGPSAKWEPTKLVMLPSPDGLMIEADGLRIQFHPARKQWDLYARQLLIREGIPYSPSLTETAPEIIIDTGQTNRPVSLRGLTIGRVPNKSSTPLPPAPPSGASRKN